jgi:hypothetical protein
VTFRGINKCHESRQLYQSKKIAYEEARGSIGSSGSSNLRGISSLGEQGILGTGVVFELPHSFSLMLLVSRSICDVRSPNSFTLLPLSSGKIINIYSEFH